MPIAASIKQCPQETWFLQLSEAIQETQIKVKYKTVDQGMGFRQFTTLLKLTRQNKGTVWLIGNGGSIATCSHMSQDIRNRLSIRTETLSDGPLLTCMSNDFSFEDCFLRPFQKLVQPHDCLVAVSCSGESENIIRTAQYALNNDIKIISLSAMKETNRLNALTADLSFWVPTDSFGIAEVAHHAILHNYIETMANSEQEKRLAEENGDLQTPNESICSLA